MLSQTDKKRGRGKGAGTSHDLVSNVTRLQEEPSPKKYFWGEL